MWFFCDASAAKGSGCFGSVVVARREDAMRDVVPDHSVLDAFLVVGVEVCADHVTQGGDRGAAVCGERGEVVGDLLGSGLHGRRVPAERTELKPRREWPPHSRRRAAVHEADPGANVSVKGGKQVSLAPIRRGFPRSLQ